MLRNKVKQQIRNNKIRYINTSIEEAKCPKEVWKILYNNGIGKIEKCAEPTVNIHNLNSYFYGDYINKVNCSEAILMYKEKQMPAYQRLNISQVDENIVNGTLSEIKSKATGPDAIELFKFKEISGKPTPILVHIHNSIFLNGISPNTYH